MSTSNPQKLDPPITVPIFIANETPGPTHFPIYEDQFRKQYLKCDLCGHELRLKNRKNTQGFLSHRGSKRCKKEKQNLLQKEEIYKARTVIQRGTLVHLTTELE